jgi:hypothetical protein
MNEEYEVVFNSGVLDVYKGEQHFIHQPFKPTNDGTQEAWADEAEALAWWEENKPVENTPAEGEENA